MYAFRTEAIINADRTLTLQGLPFNKGEYVEVIILGHNQQSSKQHTYPLRGTPVQLIDPTDPVAQSDWESSE